MNVAERVAQVWARYQQVKVPENQPNPTVTIDGDPLVDSRPKHSERMAVLAEGKGYEFRKAALYECTARAYRDGWVEGQGYVASPDMVTRRLLEGLQHVVSHVHHHCKHAGDGLESFPGHSQDVEDEDVRPTGKSAPIAAGSRLARTAWRRCRKDPCSALVQILSDCRLWDSLDHGNARDH
jgi:hypothetical protein